MADNKVMLITGAAQRIGAYIAQSAHADGYCIVLHYRSSQKQTQVLQQQLNKIRNNSCISIQADFNQTQDFKPLMYKIQSKFNRLDVLINNASEFFPTQLNQLKTDECEKLFNSNVKGPLFLSKACYPLLLKTQGNILNIVDIHADKPLKDYPVYCMAKAANKMMVKALAKEYAPDIRVNGVSPGCVIWPKEELSNKQKDNILSRIALAKHGDAKNIYQTIKFLINNDYITGQVIKVDGGRSLNM